MWRKNRAAYGGEISGVDLNRNFSFGWGGRHSSTDPSSAFFRGREPFSEPESTAMKDILMNSGIKFKVYVTLHSFGQVIVFPFGYRDELCPDYMRLLQGATAMSKAIFRSTGNVYKVGISRDVMYGASGTSTDWSYGAAKIPYCYLIELRSKEHKFELPKEEIKENCKEVLHCIYALMDFVDNNPVDNENTNLTPVPMAPPCVKALSGKTQVWEVKLNSEKQRCFIKTLDTVGAVNIWKEERSSMDIMVEGPKSTQVAELLYERSIPFAVAIGDVAPMLDREGVKPKHRKSATGSRVPMDWKSYHRLGVIYEFMESLAAEWPTLCSVCTIGRSVEGRAIKMLKISNGRYNNVGVWMDAAIHPREWISTAVLTYVADQLVRTYDQQPDYITNKDWFIVPVVNPDGYEYTHTHDRMWRKNRARYGECYGVDLNRNFSYGWGERDEEGSSDDPANIFYRGPEPFSEPETAAIRQAICSAGTQFKVFLSFHSYGEVIIFPWGYTGDPCPHYVQMLEAGTAMAKAIQQASGHIYKVGSTKDLMYYASGTSTDWSYAVANIPYSYGEVIIFPWGYTGDPCPHYVQMLEAGTAMAKAIQQASGHIYKVGSTKDLMYYASGTSTDWSYAVANIPYSYMVELRGKRHRFLLPKEEIVCTSIEVLCGVSKLMEYIEKFNKVTPAVSVESCQSPSYTVQVPRSPSWVSARCHSCRSSRSCCKSSHSPSCSRSHSRQSCNAQKCDSKHSKCRGSPTKPRNFTG
ncbi:Carboxypeptidase A1 [Papilio machaon]|uniref:Carboxypeptidase A1 n=1 Tax=Papilio machaon TaxID=76193 RepID=A0A194RME8_PAPMA|nr:Carboxypeptidase A1 [Papilio machaon]